MTFIEGVFRLARLGARSETTGPAIAIAVEREAVEEPLEPIELEFEAGADEDPAVEVDPSFADLLAAVDLVEAGLAAKVTLTGFPTWPGLLWQCREIAGETGLLIVPTTVRSGGRVDIVIARDESPDV